MNRQCPNKIDWADYTWNPISGCLHGCSYCYMRRMEKRFPGIMEPKFHEGRISEPLKLKRPSRIFVGSSGDMWGDWVSEKYINWVLDVAAFCPRHTFFFLTKNPNRYSKFTDYTENMWFGTTVDGRSKTLSNINDLLIATNGHCIVNRFVSFEPLLSKIECPNLFGLKWIIIGGDSTKGAKKPPKEWADTIIEEARRFNIPVWVKDNYGYPERIKEKHDGTRT